MNHMYDIGQKLAVTYQPSDHDHHLFFVDIYCFQDLPPEASNNRKWELCMCHIRLNGPLVIFFLLLAFEALETVCAIYAPLD